tara:strand:+ start:508 stop:774 length:267 start_codon:yes stop_codon:yes gene_type:complete
MEISPSHSDAKGLDITKAYYMNPRLKYHGISIMPIWIGTGISVEVPSEVEVSSVELPTRLSSALRTLLILDNLDNRVFVLSILSKAIN